jgi:hypothetical protein
MKSGEPGDPSGKGMPENSRQFGQCLLLIAKQNGVQSAAGRTNRPS